MARLGHCRWGVGLGLAGALLPVLDLKKSYNLECQGCTLCGPQQQAGWQMVRKSLGVCQWP
jgi:hypothetical protein